MARFFVPQLAVLLASLLALVGAQQQLVSSYPHVYPGQPKTPLGANWQSYYQVTAKLPNVTFDTGRSYAGNLPVDRAGHPNNTLFFWGYEKESGSLTKAKNNAPWGIWLNGGPGSSSLWGMLFENGPVRVRSDYSAAQNKYAWNKQADFFWVDQPVGTGFSTADADGYVKDNDQVGEDFMGFLSNLVKVFPNLATRPLHLTGESYAGVWIPYIMKAYFGMPKPPVTIASISIGNGVLTTDTVFQLMPALSIIATYPQIIGYDRDVYNYFQQQSDLCAFNVSIKYPQPGLIPSIPLVLPTGRDIDFFMLQEQRRQYGSFMHELAARNAKREFEEGAVDLVKRAEAHSEWKRDLSLRTNGTLDPWYGCLLLDMFIEYALNYTYPWTLTGFTDQFAYGFNVYNVPDAVTPKPNVDGTVFLNNPTVRAAIHAPKSKNWAQSFGPVWGNVGWIDPSPVPMTFLTELATNATKKNVKVVIYSGNGDGLIAHRGTEVAIQNTTFGGVQGFERKPATAWFDDAKKPAGVIHQERGWTYALFTEAGHMVPTDVPNAAYVFLREFILGNNPLGSFKKKANGSVTVVGGESPALAGDIVQGPDAIYYGAGATQSTTVYPAATRTAWKQFMATQTALRVPPQARR